jgi:hypothetical protein
LTAFAPQLDNPCIWHYGGKTVRLFCCIAGMACALVSLSFSIPKIHWASLKASLIPLAAGMRMPAAVMEEEKAGKGGKPACLKG